MIVLIVLSLGCGASRTVSSADTSPAPLGAERETPTVAASYDIPAGWQKDSTSGATNRIVPIAGPTDLWISVIGPMRFAGNHGDLTLEDWFGLFQEPGEVINGTGAIRGIDAQGRETILEIKVLRDEFPPCRVYGAVREGAWAAMLVMLAPSSEVAIEHASQFESIWTSLHWEAPA